MGGDSFWREDSVMLTCKRRRKTKAQVKSRSEEKKQSYEGEGKGSLKTTTGAKNI